MSSSWEKPCYASAEAGKSEFFLGPVVVAVYLNEEVLKKLEKEEYYSKLKNLSWKNNDDWIVEFAPKIILILGQNFAYSITSAKKYNKMYFKHRNMNQIFSILHNEIHLQLQNKLNKECFRVTNSWTQIDKHYEYLKNANIKALKVDEMPIKSSEKYLGCALASIIARYYYLKQIEEISKKYSIKIPLKFSYDKSSIAIEVFEKLRKNLRPERFCKVHFKTMQKITEIIHERNIQKEIIWKKSCCASDESGNGDFFGGTVVVAVYLNKEVLEKLEKEEYFKEIRDSKKCDNASIYKLAPQIMDLLEDNYEIVYKTPKEYNQMHTKFRSAKAILSILHNNVHLNLKNKLTKEKEYFLVMDKFTDWYYEYLKCFGYVALKINDMRKKAEKEYLACALASIIARYYYLKQIDEMRWVKNME